MLRPSFSLRCDSVPFCSAEHPPKSTKGEDRSLLWEYEAR